MSITDLTLDAHNVTYYGMHVSAAGSVSGSRSGFNLENVTVEGAGRSEIDLNGMHDSTLTNVTADGDDTAGVGIALSDSTGITLTDITTTGNQWGGVGLYSAGYSFAPGTSDITFNGTYASSGEPIGIYADEENGTSVENVTFNVFSEVFKVENDTFRADTDGRSDDFTFFFGNEADAVSFATTLTNGGGSDVSSNSIITGPEAVSGVDAETGSTFVVAPGMSIQEAIDHASNGDTIIVNAGTYTENLTVEKEVTLQANGEVTLEGTVDDQLGIPDGTALNDYFEANHPAYSATTGIEVGADNVVIDGFTISHFSIGVDLIADNDGVQITNNTFTDNVTGLRKSTTTDATNLSVNDNTFTQGIHGMTIYAGNGDGSFDGISMNDNSFSAMSEKGMYFEQLSNASLDGNSFDDVGNYGRVAPPFGPASQDGEFGQAIDINLKYGTYSNVTFSDTVITNSGNSDQGGAGTPGDFGAAIGVKTRDDGSTYGSNPADFTGQIVFDGGSIDGTSTGFRIGEPGKDNLGPDVLIDGVLIQNATVGDVDNATDPSGGGTVTVDMDNAQVDFDGSVSQAPLDVTGNAHDNVIHGGSADDTLAGGEGNDTYYATSGDTIVENTGEGTDEVVTSDSHTLAANVENLTLTDGASNTETFDDFAVGPIADGENGWAFAGTVDQEVQVDPDDAGNQVFRMSSDPSTGAFGGPYSPSLDATAGEPGTTADFDTMQITFSFKAVQPEDNSRLEVDFGNEDASDRNNFMVIENIDGSGLRLAVADPLLDGNWDTGDDQNNFTAFTGNRTLIEGLDASQAYQLTMVMHFQDGADNDTVDFFLNGEHVGTSTTFENYRDSLGGTHEDNAEANQVSRLFFRSSASGAPNDGDGGENQGFFFDDVEYSVFNQSGPSGTGNELDNSITGNSGDNTLSGLGGDDTLNGGLGDDVLDGGDGTDTAVYAGDRNSFTVSQNPDGSYTVAGGDEGTDTLTGVEQIQFGDVGYAVELDANSPDYASTRTWFDQSFEDGNADGFYDETNGWSGTITIVPDGTDGIASPDGSNFAIFEQSDADGGLTGPFSRMGFYSEEFGGGYKAQAKIFLDPSMADGEGFDVSMAANGQDGNHIQDFIFHVTKDSSTGDLLVGGSNNSNFDPIENLEAGNHATIDSAGWYTFEWEAYQNDDGDLDVAMNVYNADGDWVFTEVRTNGNDFDTEVGGNRYLWFTNIDVTGGIAVDDISLETVDTNPVRVIDGSNVVGTYATIQDAIDAATDGNTIQIAEGDYAENLTIDKALSFIGDGDVTLSPTSGTAIDIQAGIDGDVSFDNVDLDGGSTASYGIIVDAGANVGTLGFANGAVEGFLTRGIYASDEGDPATTPTMGDIEVTDSTFSDNGTGSGNTAHIKLFGYSGDALFQNVTFEGTTGVSGSAGRPDNAIEITGGLAGPGNAHPTPADSPDIGTIVLDGVTVTGEYHKNPIAFFHFTEIDGLSITGLDLSGAESSWGPLFNLDGIEDANIDASGYAITFPSTDAIHTELQGEESGQDVVDTTIIGTAANDSLHGKTGNDTLFGGDGNDFLYGGNKPGQDFDDGPGNDTLNGGAGDDVLVGGIGDDEYVVDNAGTDLIKDSDGDDRVLLPSIAVASALFFSRAALDGQALANSLQIDAGSDHIGIFDHFAGQPIETLELQGGLEFTLQSGTDGGAGRDVVVGTTGNDTLTGGLEDDILVGGGGDDDIDGGGGTNDVAQFNGNQADFTIDTSAGTVTHNTTGDVTTLANVETLQFLDGTVAFEVPSDLGPGVGHDFGGDGMADLIVQNDSTNATEIWNGADSGDTTSLGTMGAESIVGVGDFNGDGEDDIVGRYSSDYVRVIESGDTGSAQGVGFLHGQSIVAIGDFNADGDDDLLVKYDSSGFYRTLNSADSSDTTGVGFLNGQSIVGIGNFDGDGREDVLVKYDSSGYYRILNGADTNDATGVGFLNGQTVLGIGDFDGNGEDDLLVRYDSTDFTRILNGGDPNDARAVGFLGNQTVLGIGDFNGDGEDDFVIQYDSSKFARIFHSGDASDVSAVGDLSGQSLVTIGDFNGNGDDDLLVKYDSSDYARILEGGDSTDATGVGFLDGQTVENASFGTHMDHDMLF